jgi:hypothetical protein
MEFKNESDRILFIFTKNHPTQRQELEKLLRAFGGQCVQHPPLTVVSLGYHYAVGEYVSLKKLAPGTLKALFMHMVEERDGLHFDQKTADEWVALIEQAGRLADLGFSKLAPYIYHTYTPPGSK